MKTALIHDWLDKYGGAERVITAISEIQDFDYYYSYANIMDDDSLKATFANKNVTIEDCTFTRLFSSYFRYLMPLFPLIIKLCNEQTKRNKIDLVISSSWVLSKAYRVGNEMHICYLQARNFKYIWEESPLYFKGPLRLFSFLKSPLQKFDIKAAQNPQHIIANSFFVKDWVKKTYNREAHVIYPPVEVDFFSVAEQKNNFYITVGRLEPYKRFDIVIETFNRNGKKLIVVGDGSQLKFLKRVAKENIIFLGFLRKESFKKLLSEARAFVYAGIEDFGIAMVEAFASGTPVIAFEGGGAIELISKEKKNGLLYTEQTPDALSEAIDKFEQIEDEFHPETIRHSAIFFSKTRFQKEFSEYVSNATRGFKN